MATKFDFLSPGVNIREIDRSILPAQAQEPGPILIGRAKRGPALKPVLINTYEDFVTIFGEPVLGTAGSNSDIWRDGNTIGPQYAGIAAQAHLASQTSPVTFVRLLGDQHDSATDGYAGWSYDGLDSSALNNKTAYGLFVVDSGSAAADPTGALAAVFYATAGALSLSGTAVGGAAVSQAGTLIESSIDDYGFQLDIRGTDGAVDESIRFNLNRDDQTYYARSVFNTNPMLTNADIISSGNRKTYWLGETHERFVADTLASSSAGKVYGILLPLENGSTGLNWANRQKKMTAAQSGWVIAADTGPAASFNAENAQKLFRMIALHEGTELQKGVMVAIENITAPNDVTVNAYATFDVVTTDANGNALETMAGVDLNPESDNYIVKRFGDTTFEWQEDERRYRVKGDEPNVSNYFRVEVSEYVSNAQAQGAVPFGFLGPVRPKGFTLAYGSAGANVFGDGINTGVAATGLITPIKSGSADVDGLTFIVNDGINSPITYTFTGTSTARTSATAYTVSTASLASVSNVTARIETAIDLAFANGDSVVQATDQTTNVGLTSSLAGTFINSKAITGTYINASTGSMVAFSGGTDSDDFAGAFVKGNDSMPNNGGTATLFASLPSDYTASFRFPALALRGAGSEGSPVSEYDVYYGIRPKTGANETRNDVGYIDYLRGLPGSLDNYAPASDYEYSFVFTMDDLVVNKTTRAVTYTVGSRAAGTSYTATSGSSALLGDDTGNTDGVEIKQFIMPIWGGFDGLDVSEKEPFKNANGLAAASQTDLNNAMLYSVNLAIDSIKDNEQVIANTLSIPGVTATRVTDKIIATCETRKDLLGVIDLEEAFVPTTEGSSEQYYSVSSTINKLKLRKLNSSYACAFHPWVQVQTNTGTASGKLYVPPSVAAVGAFAKSTSQSELWFAPAGFTRGGLSPLGGVGGPRVVNVREALSSKDRDNLYKYNINPIASFPGEGIVIFGQKTLQAFPSALDRINVRRLLIYLKHELSNISRRLLFEPNVQTTWNRFKSQADGVLSNVQANLGVTEYKIVLDESTTTADLIDRNILYAKIYIKPTRAIEYIVVDLIVTNTGAEFV